MLEDSRWVIRVIMAYPKFVCSVCPKTYQFASFALLDTITTQFITHTCY